LHIGLEIELNNQGLAFPLQENKILIERLDEVLDRFSPDTFVLAGDILHSFNRLDPNVKEKFELLLVRIRKRCNPVILRGSHDTMLPLMTNDFLDRYDACGFTFVHGYNDIIENFNNLILGHEHPAIQIEMERHPCFLYGRSILDGKDMMILPAFNPLCQGTSINRMDRNDFMSPLIKRIDVAQLIPVIEIQNEVMEFPKLRDLRQYLN
jgi:hypothetical protein